MPVKDYITIIIRLVALFLLIYSLQNAISILSILIESRIFLSEFVLALIIPFIAFVLLWVYSTSLAAKVTENISTQLSHIPSPNSLLRIIVIAFGFILLVLTLIQISHWVFNSIVFTINPEIEQSFDHIHILKTSVATELVQIIIAIIILAKNSWIAQALLKINASEQPKPDSQTNQTD